MCTEHRLALATAHAPPLPPGIPQKLLAVESLLNEQPELVGKVVLLQIAVPTRTEVPEYQRLRATAHRLVGRINGKFGSTSYMLSKHHTGQMLRDWCDDHYTGDQFPAYFTQAQIAYYKKKHIHITTKPRAVPEELRRPAEEQAGHCFLDVLKSPD